jgi:hypothetical protein
VFNTIALLTGSIAVTLGVEFTDVTLHADAVLTFKMIANPNSNSTDNNNLLLIYTAPQFNVYQIRDHLILLNLRINHIIITYKTFGLISKKRGTYSCFMDLRLV